MKKITVWVKHHPYLTTGLVVGAILVFILVRRISSARSAATVIQSGGVADDPQARAQAYQDSRDDKQFGQAMQLRQFDLQAQLEVMNAQGALDIARIGAEGAVMSAHDMIELQKVQTQVSGGIRIAEITTSGAVQVEQIRSNTELGVAGIQRDIAAIVSGNQLAGIMDTNRTDIAIAGIGREVSLAGFERDIRVTELQTGRDIRVTELETTRDVDVTRLLTGRDIEVARIEVGGQITLAGIASRMQEYIADRGADVYHDYFATTRYGIDADVHIADNVLATTRSNMLDFFNFSRPGQDRWGTGENQATALATLFGNTAIGVSAQGSQATRNQQGGFSPAGIISSVLNGAANIFTSANPT